MPDPIVVLVVEDESLLRMGIVDYLQDQGFVVLEAGDSDEAIEILVARTDVSVLFTDIDMPRGVDGLKLAAAVRDRWPPIKIVITSGHRNVELPDLHQSMRFIPKPYNPDEVVRTFRTLLAA